MELQITKNVVSKRICKGILWFNGVFIVALFGVFVYTPEYNGTGNENDYALLNKGLKYYLNCILTPQFSVITLITVLVIIISIIVLLILFHINRVSGLIENNKKLQEEKLELSEHINKCALELSKVKQKEKINQILCEFVSNYDEIISVQIYEYSRDVHRKDVIYEIKPTNYYFTRKTEVANLIHEKYVISEKLLVQYNKVKSSYLQKKHDILEKYIQSLSDQLKKKEENNSITDDTMNKYALLTLSLQLDFDELPFKINNLSQEFQDKLCKLKRTGFLRGLIEEGYYKFCHSGDSYKGQRIYITKCFLDMDKKTNMFIIVLNPDVIKIDGYSDYIDFIGEKFYEVLSKEIKLVYNRN